MILTKFTLLCNHPHHHLQNFLIFPNRSSVPMKHSLPTPPPAPGPHPPTVCFYDFDSRDLLEVGSHRIFSFVSGLFHSASCPQGLFVLEQVLDSPHFLMLRYILLYGQTAVCLSVIWSWTPGLLRVLATLNNAAVNTGVQISPWDSALSSFGYIFANGIPKLEDEMVGWHQWLSGHELAQTPGDGEGQGSLVCSSPWGHKELDMTEPLNNSKVGSHCTVSVCVWVYLWLSYFI